MNATTATPAATTATTTFTTTAVPPPVFLGAHLGLGLEVLDEYLTEEWMRIGALEGVSGLSCCCLCVCCGKLYVCIAAAADAAQVRKAREF